MLSEPSRFVLSLPKAELHLHLEGSIEPSTLLELRKRHGMDGASLAEVEQLYNYKDFAGFLAAFKDVTGHLRTPEDYEVITYRLMERLKAQNVLHAEAIVSVGVCLWRRQDFPAIFEGLERGRQRGEKDFGISLLWIFDAIRQFGAEKAQSVLDLAIRFRDRNVVAFGIGGDERAGPAEWFAGVYGRAAEHGLHLTAHAGESAGPDSIWGALNLKAERIGHGLTAGQDPELIEELAESQVPIEICVTSLSVSSKVPSSSRNSTRSRADILPSLCWRSRRCAPPPSWAIWSRFFSSAIFSSSFIGRHYRPSFAIRYSSFAVRCSALGFGERIAKAE